METPRLEKAVRRVTILTRGDAGTTTPVTIYKREADRKKGTRAFRPFETAVRRWARASEASADDYLQRHERSNRKKRDGWLRDLNFNALKATRKGTKQFKITRWLGI
jgi:hypothetical protein